MRSPRERNTDLKLLAALTAVVVGLGLFVAAALLVATGDDDAVECGSIGLGSAEAVRQELEGGPVYRTGGGRCGFWLGLEEGDVVAYRAEQPDGCTLRVEARRFTCGGTVRDPADLAQYPVRIVTRDDVDALVVDLEPVPDGDTAP
ncbi:MAG: hypothetical protein KatS3mg009_0104 [Acidimicrobiia bacterium]|nr:MAG: hypothetical protein KatS3mg009_0104 [Acidimicrobiia bacterium]